MIPVLLAAALSGCPAGTPDEPVVARFGGRAVTAKAFGEHLGTLGPSGTKRARTLVGKKALLRAMIDEEILYAEAERRRLRGTREVRDAVNPALAQKVLDEDLGEVRAADVPEVDVRALYAERHDDFHRPKRWRFGVIHTASLAKARELREELRRVQDDEEIFEVLAGSPDNVEEPLRAAAGNFGFSTLEEMRRDLPEDLWPHFDRMKETEEVPEIVETPRGAFLLMVTSVQPEIATPFEEIEGSLREEALARYRNRRIDEVIATFRGRHRVEVAEGLLDRVRVLP